MATYKLSNGIYVDITMDSYTESSTSESITLVVRSRGALTYGGGWIQSNGAVAYVSIGGVGIGTKTILGNGSYIASGTTKENWWTRSISRTHSTQSISWGADIYNAVDGNQGSKLGSASGSFTIDPKTKYTVSYNVNGGSGTFNSQDKWYNETLTLHSTQPTRTGYTFQGWATSQSNANAGTVAYAAGASYTGNAALSLWAVWKIITYTVTYNANGGSNAPASQTKNHGATITLTTAKPTMNLYDFVRWNTKSDGTGTSYNAGASYSADASVTLYAQWKQSYISPSVSITSAYRSNASGVNQDDGTYANVNFTAKADRSISSTNNISTVKVEWRLSGTNTWPTNQSESFPANSESYTGSYVISNISTENQYDIRVTASDTYGKSLADAGTPAVYTVSATSYISMAFITMDFLAGGHGISFGQPSSEEGFVCGMNTRFANRVSIGAEADSPLWIEHGKANVGNWVSLVRADTNKMISFGIGTGGQNRGVYDDSGGKYMIYDDASGRTIIPDTLYLTRTTDAAVNYDNRPALMIGDYSGTHLELDGNEIIAKANGTTASSLYLNDEGGNVCVHGNPIFGAKALYSNTSGNTGTVSLSETAANFTFIEIYYGLTGIGTVTGSTQFVKVYQPNGKSPYLNLDWYYNSDGGCYTRVRKVTISGTSITTVANWGANWNNGGWKTKTDDPLAIWAVIGYK